MCAWRRAHSAGEEQRMLNPSVARVSVDDPTQLPDDSVVSAITLAECSLRAVEIAAAI